MPILFVEMLTLQLKKIERISSGHPPTPLRVRLVCDYLKSLNVSTADFEPVFKVYEFDYDRKLKAMEKRARQGEDRRRACEEGSFVTSRQDRFQGERA